VLRRLRERDVGGHELARDPAAMRRILAATRRRGFSVRAPDFGGHYTKTRREADDGRNSIAMPIRTGGHVLGCVNLTWRRKALTLTEVVQRYAGDLRAAITTIENRLADAGVGPAIGTGEGPRE
jgi:IclR family transcriptional regulator, mhp operon transcriptional activator